MKKIIFGASVAAMLVASPAVAQDAVQNFTGARVGVVVGTGGDKVIDFDVQTIGVDAGYDFDLGGAVFGVGVEYQTDLGGDIFDFNESALLARLGAKIGNNALLYASGGYSRISTGATPFGRNSESGYRIGGGVEFAQDRSYLKFEQRYFNYGGGADAFQTVAGLGFRFGAPAPVPLVSDVAPPPPPAPVEVAPATQTCADGSVVLATEICPPPPPPPMPAPAPERG